MEYFRILNLSKEPFSNSPEPEFFYQSHQHVGCLQKLELAVRLRRGLNVVIGEVGTGKTTLCRQLIRRFGDDDKVETHLLLDPHFSMPMEFLSTIAEMFNVKGISDPGVTEWQLREGIKNYLFEEGVNRQKTVVLIVDEGQKIPDFCLEIMRELLNYETNEYKLLQIVIFAQTEFEDSLKRNPGIADRISFSFHLGPLSFRDTRAMIRFRLDRASEEGKRRALFTYPAYRAIHKATGGFPRKIVMLCHQIILALIVQNKFRASWFLVRSCIKRGVPETPRRIAWGNITLLSVLVLVLGIVIAVPEKIGIIVPEAFQKSERAVMPAASVKASKVTTIVPHKEEAQKRSEGEETEPVADTDAVTRKEVYVEVIETPEPPEVERARVESLPPSPVTEVVHKPAAKHEEPLSTRSQSYPALLGSLKVPKWGIVWRMVESIYGGCDLRRLQLVAEVNPHIKDLDNVFAGDVINFPAIPVMTKLPSHTTYYRVEIAETDSLEKAYLLYKGDTVKGLPPVMLLPYWNGESGLRFSLLLREGFITEAAARGALDRLSAHVSANSRVIESWSDSTVFFSNLTFH